MNIVSRLLIKHRASKRSSDAIALKILRDGIDLENECQMFCFDWNFIPKMEEATKCQTQESGQ